MPEFVWLSDERTYAELISLGAYVSVVKYTRGGVEYEVYVTNDEFEYLEGTDSDDFED